MRGIHGIDSVLQMFINFYGEIMLHASWYNLLSYNGSEKGFEPRRVNYKPFFDRGLEMWADMVCFKFVRESKDLKDETDYNEAFEYFQVLEYDSSQFSQLTSVKTKLPADVFRTRANHYIEFKNKNNDAAYPTEFFSPVNLNDLKDERNYPLLLQHNEKYDGEDKINYMSSATYGKGNPNLRVKFEFWNPVTQTKRNAIEDLDTKIRRMQRNKRVFG